jgi:hypothetical protein
MSLGDEGRKVRGELQTSPLAHATNHFFMLSFRFAGVTRNAFSVKSD